MAEFTRLSRSELKQWIDTNKKFVLIDTLGPGSYAERHLPGAKMVDAHEPTFVVAVQKLVPDKNTPVVVYCASFTCPLSPRAAGLLVSAGYTQVYDFKGGIADWEDAGYPFES